MRDKTNQLKGFTLIEMAVVLVILALLLGGLLLPLSAQLDQKNYTDAKRQLESSMEAVMGYSLSNKHLPCPDKTAGANNGPNDNPNDGIEDFDVVTGDCITQEGNLPWATLSVKEDVYKRQALSRVHAQINSGDAMSESFRNAGLFPPLVVRMIRVGENTGALDKSLLNISYFYDRDVKDSMEKMLKLIEPTLTVILGAILGFIMFSVLGPVYDSFSKLNF